MAQLERLAASNYRTWAQQTTHRTLAIGLEICARREEAVAEIIEAIFPPSDADAPALGQAQESLQVLGDPFTEFDLPSCLKTQAAAERSGAAAWRELATRFPDTRIQHELATVATPEEESAEYLERQLSQGIT